MKKFMQPALMCAAALFASMAVSCEGNDTGTKPGPGEPTMYKITVTTDGNGNAQSKPGEAEEGAEVTISAAPIGEYFFSKWTVVSGDVQIADLTANPAKFTMPAGDVEIRAEFTIDPSTVLYNVNVTTDGNGTATADLGKAAADEEVHLTATANENYAFKQWTVVSGTPEDMTDPTKPNATFWMPAGDVTIKAEFTVMMDMDFIVDPTLRAYCMRFDTDSSGSLSQDELDAVTEINVERTDDVSTAILTLEGIGEFKNLKELNAYGHALTAVDLSQNTQLEKLTLAKNAIVELNVSMLTALKELICYNNAFTGLDVSALTGLTRLECGTNAGITALNLSANTALTRLACGGTKITELDLSANVALVEIQCNAVSTLTSINLTGLTALKKLEVQSTGLKTIDLSTNGAINYVDLERAKITYEGLVAIFDALPVRTAEDSAWIIAYDTPGSEDISTAEKNVAKNKGWKVSC